MSREKSKILHDLLDRELEQAQLGEHTGLPESSHSKRKQPEIRKDLNVESKRLNEDIDLLQSKMAGLERKINEIRAEDSNEPSFSQNNFSAEKSQRKAYLFREDESF
jgi:hypothetical protein